MPFKPNYNPKYRAKGSSYRHNQPGRAANYRAGLGQLAKDVVTLKNLINVEFKASTLALTSTVNETGTLQLLNGLTKGDNNNNREGATVRIKSVQLKGNMKIHATPEQSLVRRILFIDKQPNQTAPTMAELLDLSSSQPTDALRNLNHRKRFVILDDDLITLNKNGKAIALFPKCYKRVDMITVYDTGSNTGLIADIETNALYVLYVSNQPSNVPSIEHTARIRYIDN